MLEIPINIKRHAFQFKLIEGIKKKGSCSVGELIKEVIEDLISECLQVLVKHGIIKKCKFNWIDNKQYGYPIFLYGYSELNTKYLDWGRAEIEITSDKKAHKGISVIPGGILKWLIPEEVNPYARPVWLAEGLTLDYLKSVVVKTKELKTIRKHFVRLQHLGIQMDALTDLASSFPHPHSCSEEFLLPYLDETAGQLWLQFVCRVCGKSHMCECFRNANDKHLLVAHEEKGCYSTGGWPHKFIKLCQISTYKDNICHACSDKWLEISYCSTIHRSKSELYFGPYISRTSIEKGIDQRDAENEVRDSFGIPRLGEGWVSETTLFYIVKSLYPNHEVIHQGSPEWVGRQRLDIYVPHLNIAIEYQGPQHYEPIEYFGGEDGLSRTKERDKRKRDLCIKNGVTLVYFRYNEDVTRKIVKAKMKKAVNGEKKVVY